MTDQQGDGWCGFRPDGTFLPFTIAFGPEHGAWDSLMWAEGFPTNVTVPELKRHGYTVRRVRIVPVEESL